MYDFAGDRDHLTQSSTGPGAQLLTPQGTMQPTINASCEEPRNVELMDGCDVIAASMSRDLNQQMLPADVLLTSGFTQTLDALDVLMPRRTADTILAEELTCSALLEHASLSGTTVVGVPTDAHGPIPNELARILCELKLQDVCPRYLFLKSSLLSASDGVLGRPRLIALLTLARQYRVPIIEDDRDTCQRWSPTPLQSLFAISPCDVVYLGRMLAVPRRPLFLLDGTGRARLLAQDSRDFGAQHFEGRGSLADFIRAHERERAKYSKLLRSKTAAIEWAIRREFGPQVKIIMPRGASFVWVRFPDYVDVRALMLPCVCAGVAFGPGPSHACNPESAKNLMRLSIVSVSLEEIHAGVHELAAVFFARTRMVPPEDGLTAMCARLMP